MNIPPYDPSKSELMKMLIVESERIAREGLFPYYTEHLCYPKRADNMMAVYKAAEVEQLLGEIRAFLQTASVLPALKDEAQRLIAKTGVKAEDVGGT